MQQIDAGGLVFGDREVLLLARIVQAGLPVVAARDGSLLDADRLLAEDVFRAAELVRRRSRAGSGTSDDAAGEACASSASTWLGATEAGAAYGVSAAYIRRLARQRRLTAGRDGKGFWRIDPDALAGWAASRNRT